MSISDTLTNKLYSITSGSAGKRIILTPILGSLYLFVTLLFIIIPIKIDYWLNMPQYWTSPITYFISFPLFITGIILVIWTNTYFFLARGTPVPVNPPKKLITKGPFAYSRNPMTTGYFFIMFGFGIYYSSIISIVVFTPLFIWIHNIFFKKVEEPELEKRLGKEYTDYKNRVPMFFPWFRGRKR
jgi:protein-S-isoprenylcysteine O-methyltransferase Ste14